MLTTLTFALYPNRVQQASFRVGATMPKYFNDRIRAWRKKNRAKLTIKNREYLHKRRAAGICRDCARPVVVPGASDCLFHCVQRRLRARTGVVTKERVEQLIAKFDSQKERCPYTGQPLTLGDKGCELDHIFPSSRFPDRRADIDNLQWVSADINRAKQSLMPDEFLALCRRVIATAEGGGAVTLAEGPASTRRTTRRASRLVEPSSPTIGVSPN